MDEKRTGLDDDYVEDTLKAMRIEDSVKEKSAAAVPSLDELERAGDLYAAEQKGIPVEELTSPMARWGNVTQLYPQGPPERYIQTEPLQAAPEPMDMTEKFTFAQGIRDIANYFRENRDKLRDLVRDDEKDETNAELDKKIAARIIGGTAATATIAGTSYFLYCGLWALQNS